MTHFPYLLNMVYQAGYHIAIALPLLSIPSWGLDPGPGWFCYCWLYQGGTVCIQMHPSRSRIHPYASIRLICACESQYSSHSFAAKVINIIDKLVVNCDRQREIGSNPAQYSKVGEYNQNIKVVSVFRGSRFIGFGQFLVVVPKNQSLICVLQ